MKKWIRRNLAPTLSGVVCIICLAILLIINRPVAAESAPEPTRTAPMPTIEVVTEPVIEDVQEVESLVIPSSAIVRLSIPAISLEAQSSGETWPRQTENCKGGSEYCIDPPIIDQVAWYGDPPSFPSENPVLIFGHTSWSSELNAAFDNLPAMVAGDTVVVTTETGVFTYRAEAPALVPFVDAPESELIFGWETEKLVLVTCNTNMVDATVIVAHLESADLV